MIGWIKNLFKKKSVSKESIQLPILLESDILEVRSYALKDWKLGETHGLSHWQRVERNGILLSLENGRIREDINIKVVRFFAYLHDKCRLNDWADLEHGVRAAEMLSTIRYTILKDFTDEEIALLGKACRYHTTELRTGNPTIDVCFDADRLDLCRVGIAPNPKRMATKQGAYYAANIYLVDKHVLKYEKKSLRQKIVVLTGAGISAESGLATFRDSKGLWKQHDAKKLASAAGFHENPQAVLDFYNYRRKQLLEVEPNHAHKMLAELGKWHDVTIITQNVDNLHERAGSTHVIHLHGELTKVTSSKDRLNPHCIKDYPLDKPICLGDKAEDGSQLRPFIVWFGEYVDAIEVAMDYVKKADIFVVIGTSLTVHPAANLVEYAHPEIPKFIIDPNTKEIPNGFVHIKESATKGVDKLIEELRNL